MKKILSLFFLASVLTLAQTFTVKLSLKPHTESTYGKWWLHKHSSKQLDERYREKIRKLKGKTPPYDIEHTDIKIFHKQLYTQKFLKNGYYSLEWIPKRGTIGDEITNVSKQTIRFLKESNFFKTYHAQDGWEHIDWSMLLADYINHTIKTLPTYSLTLKNKSTKEVKIKEFYAKTIFTTGGEASPGGAYFDTSSKENFFSLYWNRKKILKLEKPISIKSYKSVSIPLSILVKKGAKGDGPGGLTIGLYVKYVEGKKNKEELIAILNQSEDYGYQTGW